MGLRNLRGAGEYAELASVIRAYAFGRRLFYAPNFGNWGDALIHFGTLQFLHHFGIAHQQLRRQAIFNIREALAPTGMRLTGAVLLAGGGGAWCRNYATSRDFLVHCAGLFDHVIVLPTSYELPPLDLHPGQVSYFRRDHGASAASVPQSQFCHDMAFFLDFDAPAPAERRPVGHFFREDHERNPGAVMPEGNLDISQMGDDTRDPVAFFEMVSRAALVRTDRMHVAIASCLMGIDCELYPGNYFKAAEVHKASIAPHYGTCRLMSWER